jgi:hypothetical protein
MTRLVGMTKNETTVMTLALTACLFGVRLFRADDDLDLTDKDAQKKRAQCARLAALDAQAIVAAVAEVTTDLRR